MGAAVAWCLFALVAELAATRREVSLAERRQEVPVRLLRFGSHHLEDLERLARAVEERVPEGAVVAVAADLDAPEANQGLLALWFAYLMPRHHVKPLHLLPSVETWCIAYKTKLEKRRMEPVFEGEEGGLYRVLPGPTPFERWQRQRERKRRAEDEAARKAAGEGAPEVDQGQVVPTEKTRASAQTARPPVREQRALSRPEKAPAREGKAPPRGGSP